MRPRSLSLLLAAAAILPLACRSTEGELHRVAKDWCLTIRASQVLPVYPLTEDLQPGDVFAVQTPLSEQTEIYEERGFLPLDQHVVRLPAHGTERDPKAPTPSTLPFAEFYRAAFWTEAWKAPAARPAPGGAAGPVAALRAAFPSYNFRVDSSKGLQLAVPISGVPLGLGLMNASAATGSVTIRDAYTYGIDIQSLYESLVEWWQSTPEIRETFARVVRNSDSEVYLRSVNRVFLASRMTVALRNVSSFGAGVDAGAAPEMELVDLSVEDPDQADAAATAYRKTLDALSGIDGAAAPGGSFRLTQASRRAVTMDETFDRPLVIGYLGFDVRVEPDGTLSPPIPSFALLEDRASIPRMDTTPAVAGFELRWKALEVGADGTRRDAVLAQAAEAVGGDFDSEFDREVAGGTDPWTAFLRAKAAFTGVESSLEAEARLQRIVEALDRALREEGLADG